MPSFDFPRFNALLEKGRGESVHGAITRLAQRHNWHRNGPQNDRAIERELLPGTELLIAFTLGAGAWWVLVRFFGWVSGALT